MYIKVSDKNKCYRSAFNWTDWFYNLNALETHKDDIICDRTSVIEKLIECFNEQLKSLRITRMLLEKWWYGSQIVDEYLKGIFGSNEKYEFAQKMRDQFQKAVCRHPLEWDKTLFNCKKIEDSYFDITHTHLREHIKTKLIKEIEQSDIWEGALQNLFKKNDFYFVNPLYFAHHLDRAEVFGFNPYEGKIIVVPSSYVKKKNRNTGVERNVGSPGKTMKVIDNPGFAPLHKDNADQTKYVFNKLSFANITGAFNEDYLDVERGTGNTYREEGRTKFFHEGIDFHGNADYNIVSFIHGEVLGWGWFGSYGRTIFVGHSSGKGVYLLAHLNSYNKDVLNKKLIHPYDIVGTVGGSGNGKDGVYGSHLHVTYFDQKWKNTDIIRASGDTLVKGNAYVYTIEKIRNPFNHKEEY